MARSGLNENSTVIAEFLNGNRKDVIVGPNEFLIVVKDGALTADGSLDPGAKWEIIRTEGKHMLRQGGMFGSQHNIRSLLANGSMHSLDFWTVDPGEVDLSEAGGHSVPVLSKDGMVIPMHVTVMLAIDPENATKLFRLTQLRTTQKFTTGDLQKMLRAEVMANVIAPTIASYEASEIRGNENLRHELLSRLRDTFASYFEWYGIDLAGNKLAVEWGLTEAEAHRIEVERKAREEALRPPEPTPKQDETAGASSQVQAPHTGIDFINTGQIGGSVTIEQNIKGGVHASGSEGNEKSGNGFKRAIVVFGIVGAIGLGLLFLLRLVGLGW
jgi:hypothetical protein